MLCKDSYFSANEARKIMSFIPDCLFYNEKCLFV